jgi:hypothetical protein
MSKNEIVVYKPKKDRDKMLANLAKAREARGKLTTRLKQLNRAKGKLQKAAVTSLLRSVSALCKILVDGIPMVLTAIADKIPNQKEQKAIRRISKKK